MFDVLALSEKLDITPAASTFGGPNGFGLASTLEYVLEEVARRNGTLNNRNVRKCVLQCPSGASDCNAEAFDSPSVEH